MFWTNKEVALNKVAKFVLEVYLTKDPANKAIVTFYVVCLPPKEILLTVGDKEAKINGKIAILDSPAFISSGKNFVPLRFIGASFGCQVSWDSKTQQISLILFVLELDFWIGKKEMQTKIGSNYKRTYPIEAPPVLKSKRTFVPLRIVSESFGAEVIYDQNTRLITIHFPPISKYKP